MDFSEKNGLPEKEEEKCETRKTSILNSHLSHHMVLLCVRTLYMGVMFGYIALDRLRSNGDDKYGRTDMEQSCS